jgi:hypothetical protein
MGAGKEGYVQSDYAERTSLLQEVTPDGNNHSNRHASIRANRLRYYHYLSRNSNLQFTLPPDYIAAELYVRGPIAESGRTQGSLTTIFSTANTMLGSSLLALPWGFTQSGFIVGLAVVLIIGLICFYTASLIVKNSKDCDDFSDMCRACFGKPGLSIHFQLSFYATIIYRYNHYMRLVILISVFNSKHLSLCISS